MTSIQKFKKEIERCGLIVNGQFYLNVPINTFEEIFKEYQQLHKQEIIDAYNKSFELRDKPYSTADKYYEENFIKF